MLDRIILIYNSLGSSRVNEHVQLFLIIGKVYVYLQIDRNLHNMCEPDQEFLEGLCEFYKQISKVIEKNVHLQ